MNHTDFIPRNDAEFNTFFDNIVSFVLDNYQRLGHISQAQAYELESTLDDWVRAYEKTLVPHIPQLTTEKNRVRVVAERALRAFINRFLRWPPVTDLERDKLGIRNWDTVPSTAPVPSSIPEIEADTAVIRRLSFRLRDFGATSWAKPAHVHAMEFAWGIMEGRPADISLFPHNEVATANPIILDFHDDERGLRVFYAARWLNGTAKTGPWSDIESSIIP